MGRKGREAGLVYEFENEQIGTDFDALRKNLETRFAWIWDEDLEAELKEAEAIMNGK